MQPQHHSAVRLVSSEDTRTAQTPRIPIAGFLQNLTRVLPKLIKLVHSHEMRGHPTWGKIIPYHIPSYGTGVSRGHCVRPDVLLTEQGPRICELDFVPSGRGYLLAGLSEDQQSDVLECYLQWYRRMGVHRVLFATATTTTCREEAEFFARLMRSHGLDIRSVNIDDMCEEDLSGAFIDRLFYRSEMSMEGDRRLLKGCDVSTAEPHLDSKAIFAMLHDRSKPTTTILSRYLGDDDLAFLREVCPETVLLSSIDEKRLKHVAEDKNAWVIKNTGVEIDEHWGSRGVIVGRKYNCAKFLDILRGNDPSGKSLGNSPILQRWQSSRDWWHVWNGVVDGDVPRTRLLQHGSHPDPVTFAPATKLVGARIGFYFLISCNDGQCTVTPYGDTMLRQDELVHGAKDAIGLALEAY